MQRYLDVVAEFCYWLGIKVNMEKTEACGYDYGLNRELDVSLLRLQGQALKKLGSLESFKYLGIRL